MTQLGKENLLFSMLMEKNAIIEQLSKQLEETSKQLKEAERKLSINLPKDKVDGCTPKQPSSLTAK